MADFEWVNIADLNRWERNPRENDKAVPDVAKSIQRFGFVAPVVVWPSADRMVAGDTRIKAMRYLLERDESFVPKGAPGPHLVPVRFHDFENEAEAVAYGIADNKLNELADWQTEALADLFREELEPLDDGFFGIGFEQWELDDILGNANGVGEGGAGGEGGGEAPGLEEGPAHSVVGEVYELGPHRLVCGDSTSPEVWALVMLPGEGLRLVWTDPPYGVKYDGGARPKEDGYNMARAKRKSIANDSLEPDELHDFLMAAFNAVLDVSEKGAPFYVAAPPGPMNTVFGVVLGELGIHRHTLVWVKDRLVLGRGDYHYQHEPIFYGWKPGAGRLQVVEDRTQTTTRFHARPSRSPEHPTMKPLELIEPMIENSSKPGDLVGEPFGGSGSTLMAAARTGRICRIVELDPHYCDVIRRRWTKFAVENGIDPGPGALAPVED